MIFRALVICSFLLLAGCSSGSLAALAGLGGAGVAFGGQSLLNRAQEDVEAKVMWRVERRKIVAIVMEGFLADAKAQRNKGDTAGWARAMLGLLEFHDTQRPETLIKELKRRRDADTTNDTGKP